MVFSQNSHGKLTGIYFNLLYVGDNFGGLPLTVFTFYIVLQKQVEMSKFTVDIRVSLSTLFDQRAIIMSYTL